MTVVDLLTGFSFCTDLNAFEFALVCDGFSIAEIADGFKTFCDHTPFEDRDQLPYEPESPD